MDSSVIVAIITVALGFTGSVLVSWLGGRSQLRSVEKTSKAQVDSGMLGAVDKVGEFFEKRFVELELEVEKATEELKSVRIELTRTRTVLTATEGRLAVTEGSLARTKADLVETQAQLAETRFELATVKKELMEEQVKTSILQEENAALKKRRV